MIRAERHVEVLNWKKGKIKSDKLIFECRMLYANIPREFWKVELDNFKGNKRVVKMVKKYCNNLKLMRRKGIGFIFMGTNGIGKTSLQMVVLKEALRQGYSAFHFTLSEIFKYIYAGYGDRKILLELDNIIRTTDFIAIGELGKDYHRKGSKLYMKSEFDAIFRYRRSRCLPTSLDTNMSEENMEGTYGESIISLFMSRLVQVKMKGEDYRKTIQKNETRLLLLKRNGIK